MKTIVHDLLQRTIKNPNVDFTRGGKYKLDADGLSALERKFVTFLSSQTGGPLKYDGKDMKSAHQGMMITEDQFDTMNGDLSQVMQTLKIDQESIDELISVISLSYESIREKK